MFTLYSGYPRAIIEFGSSRRWRDGSGCSARLQDVRVDIPAICFATPYTALIQDALTQQIMLIDHGRQVLRRHLRLPLLRHPAHQLRRQPPHPRHPERLRRLLSPPLRPRPRPRLWAAPLTSGPGAGYVITPGGYSASSLLARGSAPSPSGSWSRSMGFPKTSTIPPSRTRVID